MLRADSEFSHGSLNVEVHCLLADAKNPTHRPGGLSVIRPLQDLELAIGESRSMWGVQLVGREKSLDRKLRMRGKQVKISHHACEHDLITRQRLLSVDARYQVLATGSRLRKGEFRDCD
jgi:hypothetical protein